MVSSPRRAQNVSQCQTRLSYKQVCPLHRWHWTTPPPFPRLCSVFGLSGWIQSVLESAEKVVFYPRLLRTDCSEPNGKNSEAKQMPTLSRRNPFQLKWLSLITCCEAIIDSKATFLPIIFMRCEPVLLVSDLLYGSDVFPVVTLTSSQELSCLSIATAHHFDCGPAVCHFFTLSLPDPTKAQIWSLTFTHSHCMTDDWSLYSSLSFSIFSFPLHPLQKRACVCMRVAETACEACNWVCPPTAMQQRQRSIVSGTIDTYTYSSHSATEPQHWRAISKCSSGVCFAA